ncbi:hypothetical protein RB2150_03658 [Rhodobacterales bacterium HTCC2150]|nr:hypothetical protein RB2150_03658 [Rhodobacterales bacterium HTCC2150] [Rhodobacteraceae bacterium HTCC2150]
MPLPRISSARILPADLKSKLNLNEIHAALDDNIGDIITRP